MSSVRLGEGHAVVLAAGLTPETYAGAVEHLAAADPVLAGVVERWGPPPFWRHPEGFAGLVHGILAQQASLESAIAAYGPLEGALGRVEHEAFLTPDDEVRRALVALRGIGRWTARRPGADTLATRRTTSIRAASMATRRGSPSSAMAGRAAED